MGVVRMGCLMRRKAGCGGCVGEPRRRAPRCVSPPHCSPCVPLPPPLPHSPTAAAGLPGVQGAGRGRRRRAAHRRGAAQQRHVVPHQGRPLPGPAMPHRGALGGRAGARAAPRRRRRQRRAGRLHAGHQQPRPAGGAWAGGGGVVVRVRVRGCGGGDRLPGFVVVPSPPPYPILPPPLPPFSSSRPSRWTWATPGQSWNQRRGRR